jgi:hypothetical protein
MSNLLESVLEIFAHRQCHHPLHLLHSIHSVYITVTLGLFRLFVFSVIYLLFLIRTINFLRFLGSFAYPNANNELIGTAMPLKYT